MGEGDGALHVLFAQASLFRIDTPPMLIVCVLYSGGCCPQAFGLCRTPELTYCLGNMGAWLLCLSVSQNRMTEFCTFSLSLSTDRGCPLCVGSKNTAPSPSPSPFFSPRGRLLSSWPAHGEKKGKGEGDGALYVLFAQASLFRIDTPPMLSVCVLYSGGCCPQAFGLCRTPELTYCLGNMGAWLLCVSV